MEASIAASSLTLSDTPPSYFAWTKNFRWVASRARAGGSSSSLKSSARQEG